MGYWEIQKSPDLCLSYECVTTPPTSEKCWIFFGLGGVSIRHRAKFCSQRSNAPFPSSRRAEGADIIPHAVFHISTSTSPAQGRTKLLSTKQRSQIQSGKTGLSLHFPNFQILHLFRWGQIGTAIRTQVPMVLTNKVHATLHGHASLPAGRFRIYLDDPFCKLFLLLSVKSRLLLKLSLKLLYRYILYR